MILRRHGFAESWTLPLSLFDIQSDERTESACAFDFGDDRGHSGCALKPEFAEMLARLMAVAVIGLIGWGAIIASHIAASLYLRRFSLDSDDNLLARKHNTQVRVLSRTLDVVLVLLTLGAALMTFPAVRQYGLSLFASAGIAGIIAGLAARNLMAGVQLAMTQPIRLYDGVTVENEYGTVEEITSTYVVVKLWDLRRLIVPLTYFIEKPFQNWTRVLYVDYAAPVDVIRAKFSEILKQSDKWEGRIAALRVTDFKEGTMELRCLMSARTASQTFDLRCVVRKADRIFAERTPGSAASLAPDQPQGSARGTEDAALAGEPLKRIRPA
jgi:Mechanosensitive ion channel, beta-domain